MDVQMDSTVRSSRWPGCAGDKARFKNKKAAQFDCAAGVREKRAGSATDCDAAQEPACCDKRKGGQTKRATTSTTVTTGAAG